MSKKVRCPISQPPLAKAEQTEHRVDGSTGQTDSAGLFLTDYDFSSFNYTFRVSCPDNPLVIAQTTGPTLAPEEASAEQG